MAIFALSRQLLVIGLYFSGVIHCCEAIHPLKEDVSKIFAQGFVEIADNEGETYQLKCCCREKNDECKLVMAPPSKGGWYGRGLKSNFADVFSHPDGCGRLVGPWWHNYRHEQLKVKKCIVSKVRADELRKNMTRKDKRHGMQKVCELSASDYRALAVCSVANIDAWKRKRQNQAVNTDAQQCNYDETSGDLSCGYEASCAGGDELFGGIVIRELTVRFDCKECDKQAGGMLLRPGCCDACTSLQSRAAAKQLTWRQQKPDQVICNGCDMQSLNALIKDSDNNKHCSFQGNKFQCKTKASCKIGQGSEKVTDNSYTCRVTPCGACQNDALKAECCSECLQHACSSNESEGKKNQLFVCTGCEEPNSGSWFWEV